MQIPYFMVYAIVYACELSFISFAFSLNHIIDDFPNFTLAGIIATGIVFNYYLASELHISPYIGSAIAFLAGGALGALTHSLFNEMKRKGRNNVLLTLASLGSMIVLTMIAKIWQYWIREHYPLIDFAFFLKIYDFKFLNYPGVFYFSLLLFILAIFTLFYNIPKMNHVTVFKAILENHQLAAIQGINIKQYQRICWVFSGGVSCFIGAQTLLLFQESPDGAYFMLVAAIAGSLLGGVSSLKSSFLGGFLMGALEIGTIMIAQLLLGPWVGDFRQLIPILVLSVVLYFRPEGIINKTLHH